MAWSVRYYRRPNGECPVEAWLSTLPKKKDEAAILAKIQKLREEAFTDLMKTNMVQVSKDVSPSILDRLGDAEFRLEFGAELARSDLAMVLVRARNGAGVTQAELGQTLGVSQAYIAKLESGEANPTLATTGKLFAALGLRLLFEAGQLVPGVEPGQPSTTMDLVNRSRHSALGGNSSP